MMRTILFDTHVHFDDLLKALDIQAVLDAAPDVGAMVAVGGSPESNRQALELAGAHPQRIRAALAFGRGRAGLQDSMAEIRTELRGKSVVAVGETGLDLRHNAGTRDAQIRLFEQMLEMARELRLPAVVHSRDAEEITLDILAEHARLWKGASCRIGVLHCFTGSRKFADRLLDMGFFISFSGILTFKNAADVRAAAAAAPEDRILIETDSPYLAPEPHRGGSNQPAFVRHVAGALAAVRKRSFEDIAATTTRNAERLFNDEPSGSGS